MPIGSKSKYTSKQRRQAKHIEEGYEKKGVSTREAVKRAWQTVNKQTGGGEKSGSGRTVTPTAKRKTREESGQRAAASRRIGSLRVQRYPTKHRASTETN